MCQKKQRSPRNTFKMQYCHVSTSGIPTWRTEINLQNIKPLVNWTFFVDISKTLSVCVRRPCTADTGFHQENAIATITNLKEFFIPCKVWLLSRTDMHKGWPDHNKSHVGLFQVFLGKHNKNKGKLLLSLLNSAGVLSSNRLYTWVGMYPRVIFEQFLTIFESLTNITHIYCVASHIPSFLLCETEK